MKTGLEIGCNMVLAVTFHCVKWYLDWHGSGEMAWDVTRLPGILRRFKGHWETEKLGVLV
jgi:hypothetical protein